MPEALKPLLLLRLARSRRSPPVPDPADMGTAFGLEYILDQAVHDGAGVTDTAPRAAPDHWLRRWLAPKTGR
ncbi:MAG: hypothetical protein HY855_10950 [Burkholderiales bacterium]|nr:hypothetical protein [Burkholderiales bacterium]